MRATRVNFLLYREITFVVTLCSRVLGNAFEKSRLPRPLPLAIQLPGW